MSYPKYIAQSQVLNISCYRIKAAPALFAVSYNTRNEVVSQYAASGEFSTNCSLQRGSVLCLRVVPRQGAYQLDFVHVS
jgi:hypothetical protein